MDDERLSLSEVAARTGVTAATLRRWAESGVIPDGDSATKDGWTPAAAAHARVVARLRERGHSLEQIRRATEEGRLAYGLLEELYPEGEHLWTLDEAAAEVGLEPELIERVWLSMGFARHRLDALTDEDLQALRYVSSVLAAGFPLVAFLQLTRVYGQAVAQIADAETRLFHIYVHEPLMREGVPSLEMAEEMAHLGRDLLPLASPLMDYMHQSYLQYFSEQDVIGHMEAAGVVARARGGEVLVTGQVIDELAEKSHLRIDPIGQVKLKGFNEPRTLCRVSQVD